MTEDIIDEERVLDSEQPDHNSKNIRYVVSATQIPSFTLTDLNLPPELGSGFWALNTYNQRLTTPSDVLLVGYCPLLIGPYCTPLRYHDFCRLIRTFTIWIVILQISIYFYMLSSSNNPIHNTVINPSLLIKFGCLSPPEIKNNLQYWRCVTTILVHSSFMHVCINVFIELFFILGRESNWNTLRTLSIFVLSSICGSFFTLVLSPGKYSTGASCGIFGVFGSFFIMYFIMFEKLQWRHRIGVLFLVVVLLIFLIMASSQKGIDGWGHIGGFLFGLSFGLIIFSNKCTMHSRMILSTVIGSIISILLIGIPLLIFQFNVSVKNLYSQKIDGELFENIEILI